ncbi:uncharacterized protein [Nicotiana sylvestris]|uniref:uncharacterized protein n=1 Tax=Nicotiana sylvestris TaxID=4096 RepID=UPI00388C3ABA
MCETFKIKHKNSTTYRPQMNEAIEAANKNIKKILRKMVENHKQWHEKLPFALLGYRTTVCTSIGATLYMLVYGIEAIIPAEVEIPSLKVIQEAELSDAFHQADTIWGTTEEEALAGLKDLFLEDEDMDCSAIIEEEEEAGLSIQTVANGVVLRN